MIIAANAGFAIKAASDNCVCVCVCVVFGVEFVQLSRCSMQLGETFTFD